MACAERNVNFASSASSSESEWKVFKGDEIGALLGHWMYEQYTGSRNEGRQGAMFASAVSSKFIKTLCEKEGLDYYETLTGKWI
jgi:phosphomannomutase